MEAKDEFNRVYDSVTKQPLHREVLLAILDYCECVRDQADIEAHVAAIPEAAGAMQSPYRLMQQLVASGGLTCTELDAQGQPIDPAAKEGLTEDELDDLVQGWRYETTEAGKQVVAHFAPARRMARLLDVHPTAAGAYSQVMRYCEQPRSRDDLAAFIEHENLLETIQAVLPKGSALRPSVLMDKLEAAGMLAWQNGWTITDAGRRYLQEG